MGSSESGGLGLVENGAGSIVWVRRRNGSWWPGKILGPDELSATHLMSPRSGTPVKLLGREDASVDWYNLEKSKRVKAFRCGEFDDCIERAEASLGLPAKKREKYARREDAILHALELEKQFLEKKYGKLITSNSVKENSSDSERKELATSAAVALENGNGKVGNHGLYQLDKKGDISNMMEGNVPLHAQKSKEVARSSLLEHNAEANRRMRGLQDLGLRTVPVNRMIYASGYSNRMAIDGHPYAVSASDPCFENSSDSDSRNSIGKGKRLLEGFIEEPLPKRRGRHHAGLPNCSLQPDGDFISMYEKEQAGDGMHRSIYLRAGSPDMFNTNGPQIQMDSRLEMGNCHPQHGTFAEETTGGSSEETESDSSGTQSIEPHVEAGMILSDAETRIRPQQRTCDRLEMQGGHESTSSDESDELSFDDRSQFYLHDPNSAGVGVSKWQLKGKRNVRNLGKRPMDRIAHTTYPEGRGRSLNQRAPSHSLSYYHDNDYSNDVDFIEDDFDHSTQGFGKRGYLPSQAAAKRQNFLGQNMIDWEDLTWGRPFRGYWDERGGCFNPTFVGRSGQGMLIDVDLKVQANRQGEHVPWVSLMSRLNGKPIIGHPIQIEALEDGSTDIFVSTSEVYGDLKYDIDRNRVPQVWKTARRTANVRVPRPHVPSQLDGDEDVENQYVHQYGKVRSKKSLASSSLNKGSLTKKTHMHGPKSPLQGMKKPPRKGNLSTSQKTKTLSSIGFDQKLSNNRRDNDSSYYMDGVIKSVDSGPPAVACIPVKLVFSRLLEAVGRPPSGPAKHGVSLNSNKERNPS